MAVWVDHVSCHIVNRQSGSSSHPGRGRSASLLWRDIRRRSPTPAALIQGEINNVKYMQNGMRQRTNRREFVKTAAGIGTGLLAASAPVLAQSRLNKGDAAILRFLAAVELIESDLWIQYNELGGVQDREVPGHTGGNEEYMNALANLDGDMPQYIHDNTEDEISHAAFINSYLPSRGADPRVTYFRPGLI